MRKSIIFILIILYCTYFVFVSCDGGQTADLPDVSCTSAETAAEDGQIKLCEGGEPLYVIVRGDASSDAETECAMNLRDALNSLSGVEFKLETDWISRGEAPPVRREILVGVTNRAESVALVGEPAQNEGIIAVSGDKIVVAAKNGTALKSAVDAFIENVAISSGGVLTVDAKLKITAKTSSRAEYVGESFTLELNDVRYGGGQFIAKLYTEGLGRGPEASEYKSMADIIYEKGCTQETLAELARGLFSSAEFAALGLTDTETAFAVYRAVLSRDPDADEIAAFGADTAAAGAADAAEDLVLDTGFTILLKELCRGSGGWKGSSEIPADGTVYTAAEINALLAASDTVLLPRGSLVLVDEEIILADGKTLGTEGNPSCYLKMARLLRVRKGDFSIINITGAASVKNLWIDGNRSGVGVCGGANVFVAGGNASVTGCKMCETAAPTNMATVCTLTGEYIAYNLITCYSSTNTRDWTDGITHQARGIIEYNTVVDATDCAIVVFRDWSGAPQDSVIRYNKIINVGNSAFGGLHTDAWRDNEGIQSFEGCAFYGNELWTSMKTHFNLCLSAASKAWHPTGNDAFGAAFYNNRTPDGLYAVCGTAIAVDGMDKVSIRGNNLRVYIADLDSGVFGTHLIALNDEGGTYDVQLTYDNTPLHDAETGQCLIGERRNDWAMSWTLREGIIEDADAELPPGLE